MCATNMYINYKGKLYHYHLVSVYVIIEFVTQIHENYNLTSEKTFATDSHSLNLE